MKEKIAVFTLAERYWLDPAGERCAPPLPNQCFGNAQRLVLANESGKLRYHEGYLAEGNDSIEFPHAWCSINGKVFDPTPFSDLNHTYRHVTTVSKRRLSEHARLNGVGGVVTFLPGLYADIVVLPNGKVLINEEANP